MAIQVQGNTGVVAEVEANRALRVIGRPTDPSTLGSYRISVVTGTMAAGLAADSEIVQFRWTDTTRLCVLDVVRFDGAGSITAFAAGFWRMYATIARSFTVAGTGGGTATLTGNNQKLRTSMGTTLVGEIRTATTAALTAGTKTLDAQGIGSVMGGVGAAPAVNLTPGVIYDSMGGFDYPIVLAANEGVIIRATVPATGTWTGGFTFAWTEMASY